jgi:hypothetical protein
MVVCVHASSIAPRRNGDPDCECLGSDFVVVNWVDGSIILYDQASRTWSIEAPVRAPTITVVDIVGIPMDGCSRS